MEDQDKSVEADVAELTEQIVKAKGVLLKSVEAAEVLRIPPWKMSQIPREELPRAFGRGRGGVRINAVHLARYIAANTSNHTPEATDVAPVAGEDVQQSQYIRLDAARLSA